MGNGFVCNRSGIIALNVLNGVDVIVSTTGSKVGIGVGNGDRLVVCDGVGESELNGGA